MDIAASVYPSLATFNFVLVRVLLLLENPKPGERSYFRAQAKARARLALHEH
jgi:hypothetical protein